MLDDLWRKTMSFERNWGHTPTVAAPARDGHRVNVSMPPALMLWRNVANWIVSDDLDWTPINDNWMLLGPPSPFAKNGCQRSTIRDYERTIEPRTHTNRCDDANESSSGSNHRDRPNGSCRSTQPSTMLSTSNAIFYRVVFSRSFEPRRLWPGIKVGLQPDPDHDPIVATATVNVSMPTRSTLTNAHARPADPRHRQTTG